MRAPSFSSQWPLIKYVRLGSNKKQLNKPLKNYKTKTHYLKTTENMKTKITRMKFTKVRRSRTLAGKAVPNNLKKSTLSASNPKMSFSSKIRR